MFDFFHCVRIKLFCNVAVEVFRETNGCIESDRLGSPLVGCGRVMSGAESTDVETLPVLIGGGENVGWAVGGCRVKGMVCGEIWEVSGSGPGRRTDCFDERV